MRIRYHAFRSQAGALLSAMAVVLAVGAAGCEPERPKLTHEKSLGKVRTVAVLPFIDGPGPKGKGSGRIVVNAAIVELYRCPGIVVVEASRLKAIMNELDLRLASGVDANTASKVGRRAGADVVILGEVTQYEAQQEYGHGAVHMFSAGGTKHIHRVGLSIRAVNVRDSRIIYAELGQGTSKKGFSPAAKLAAAEALGPWRRFFEGRNGPGK